MADKTAPAALLPRPSAVDDPEENDAKVGPVAGMCEAFLLLWCVPGFGMVALFAGLLAGGTTVPWVFVLPGWEKEIWGISTATNVATMLAGRSLMSVLFCAHFGKWSDKAGRKLACAIMAISSLCVGLPRLFGNGHPQFFTMFGLVVFTGPMAVHLSGSPVLWAFASDYLAPEHKEVGFAIVGGSCSLGSFFTQMICVVVSHQVFDPDPVVNAETKTTVFLSIVVVYIVLAMTILFFVPPGAYMPEPSDADIAEEAEEQGFVASVLGPLRLVAKKPALRACCAVICLITLPDMAASDIATQVIYEMLGVTSQKDMVATSGKWSTYPLPFNFFVVLTIGILARRYGPSRTVRVWVPISSLLFSMPLIMLAVKDTWAITLGGLCVLTPLSNYGPLQALVAHIVPPQRIGEAMGAIATCKNVVSLIAPVAVAVFSRVLEDSDNNDKLWLIYPICTCIMLTAWPFTFCLDSRVARDTNMKWDTWASGSRPSTIKTALNARSSAMFSARASGQRSGYGGRPSTRQSV